jgi:hypothetical protein
MKYNSQSNTRLNYEIGESQLEKKQIESTGLTCQTHNPSHETRIT